MQNSEFVDPKGLCKWESIISCYYCKLQMETLIYDTKEEATYAGITAWNKRI